MIKRRQLNAEKVAIEEQAARWIVELEEGLSPEKISEFEAWRSADVRHEAAIQELQTTSVRLLNLKQLSRRIGPRPNPDLLAPVGKAWYARLRHPAILPAATAACLIFVFLVVVLNWNDRGESTDAGMLVSTGNFDYSRLNLDDGSVLEVNANSSVRVEYQDTVRMVELIRGEAHFDVQKDALRPFLVQVNGIVFRAVGTAFNVRMEPKTVKLLVTEGRVAVDRFPELETDRTNALEREARQSDHSLPEVVAGQQVILDMETDTDASEIDELDEEAIKTALAWKGPRLFFDGTPIAEAVRQFNEHNTVQVTVADPEIGRLQIGGSFLISDIDAFLRLLEINNHISVDRPSPDRAVILQEDPL